eukprot:9499960-Pyramimonas_sp.AAC.1
MAPRCLKYWNGMRMISWKGLGQTCYGRRGNAREGSEVASISRSLTTFQYKPDLFVFVYVSGADSLRAEQACNVCYCFSFTGSPPSSFVSFSSSPSSLPQLL